VAKVRKDMVAESSTTTGTGNITLAGAKNPGRTFNTAGVATSDTFKYRISHDVNNEWEVGIGTLLTSTTFSRNPKSSSNANALVSFSAGNKTVELVVDAEDLDVGLGAVLTQTSAQTATAATTNLTAGTYTVPASHLEVGSEYEFEATLYTGRGATLTATNVIIELLVAGTAVRTLTIAINASSTQNRGGKVYGRLTVRTTGASGTMMVSLQCLNDIAGTAGAIVDNIDPARSATSPGTTAIDTTATKTLELRARLSAATATCYLHLLHTTIVKVK
jgi:hypothetical protein